MHDTIQDSRDEKLRLIKLILAFDESRQKGTPSPEWYGERFNELYDMSLGKLKVFAVLKKIDTK